MRRAIVLVLDSFGIGSAPDAATFGDQGQILWATSPPLVPVAKQTLPSAPAHCRCPTWPR